MSSKRKRKKVSEDDLDALMREFLEDIPAVRSAPIPSEPIAASLVVTEQICIRCGREYVAHGQPLLVYSEPNGVRHHRQVTGLVPRNINREIIEEHVRLPSCIECWAMDALVDALRDAQLPYQPVQLDMFS